MKKLFAILLALAMFFAMAITAFAAEETVKLTFTGIMDHTYYIYQIYKGDAHENGDKKIVLSNVVYGFNYYPTGSEPGGEVPDGELKDFQQSTKPEDFFNTGLKKIDEPYAKINDGDDNEENVEINVAPGYYMIVDKSTTETGLPDDQTISPVILCAVGPTTIASKHATISSTKYVKDINDSTDETTNWQKSADYDIGDEVPFRLEVNLPSTMSAYATYPIVIHDQQAAGFAFPQNIKVYIERAGNKLFDVPNTSYSVGGNCGNDECEYKTACSFHISFANVNALYTGGTFAKDDVLVVEYTSTLDNDADGDGKYDVVSGRAGNENSMYVHHPDGHTKETKVTVLTYALTINKVDGDNENKPLMGAGFTLYKYNPQSTAEDKYDAIAVGKNVQDDTIIYELKGTTLTTFTWSGLDDGKYVLRETTTPKGYNTIADVYFTLEASHKAEWLADGNYAFDSVSAKTPDGQHNVYLDKDENGNMDGNLEGSVENYQGVVLPSTGAEGTFFMITGGALLVMVAAVFLVTRKKMSVYED